MAKRKSFRSSTNPFDRRRSNDASKNLTFALLMLLAAGLMTLPPRYTNWMRIAIQPLQWLPEPVSAGLRGAERGLREARQGAMTPEAAAALRERNARLRRQVLHQQRRITALEEHLAVVSGVREQLQGGRITIARIAGFDTSPNRHAIAILDRGATNRIRRGDWVAAGAVPDAAEGGPTGRDLLLRQWLIGRVVQSKPRVAMVQLTTDPDFGGIPVRVARVVETPTSGGRIEVRWDVNPDRVLLYGVGRGRMQIREAPEDYFANGYTHVLAAVSDRLPESMVIGRMTGASRLRDEPLFYNLTVEPIDEVRRLTFTYVISLDPGG